MPVLWIIGHGHCVLLNSRGSCYTDHLTRPLVIPYSKLHGWADHIADRTAGQFPTVIFDEVHELRGGTSTRKGAAAARIADAARTVLGMTGTLVNNYGDEVHSIYEVIHPDALGSRTEFLREWGGGQRGNHTEVADPAALGAWLRDQGLLLRRTRRDVGRELPHDTPLRIYHEVEADAAAMAAVNREIADMARLILDRTADRQDRWHAAGELDWRLRQATGIAKAPYVAELVRMLLVEEQRVVLWGHHRAVYDIWMDRLAEYHPVLYTGTESPRQKQAAVDAFRTGEARVFIMALRSGAGLDGLQHVCSTGVFGELDWSPGPIDQAIGRLARDGQRALVKAYFPVSDQGADPTMSDTLALKRGQADPLMDPDAPLVEAAPEAALDRVQQLARDVLARQARRGTAA